ncbi:MAG TPA: hypothetical protein ENJ09_01845 [Planctomycetes bacterium]|nr:hypothetical protein [Planctomycetota bacterium]
MELLILKTGALGDVLRTTAILPGLRTRYPQMRVTWVTAPAARDLVALHPEVARVVELDVSEDASLHSTGEELSGVGFQRILSLDDEEPMCRLASRIHAASPGAHLTGAFLAEDGSRTYTEDAAPWFDMGLLSRFGKERADAMKRENRESQGAIYARMLGIEPGRPELPLPDGALAFAAAFAERTDLHGAGPVIGLNTGAGGRWESKRLPPDRVVELARELDRRLDRPTFLLFGGPDERERNARIAERIARETEARLVDAGVENALLDFAALLDRVDLLVTSDSLALHIALARRRPVVAFFAPTSAAEIDVAGLGEKVVSTAPDACTYRPDVDTSTLTVERLADAACRVLAAHASRAEADA